MHCAGGRLGLLAQPRRGGITRQCLPSSPGRSATSPSSVIAARARPRSSRRLLYQAGETNRLGTIDAGLDDLGLGRRRAAADDVDALAHPRRVAGPQAQPDRRPGRPELPGRGAWCSLRVVEGALVVLSGVMGVEVGTSRGLGGELRSSGSRASSSSTCSTASGPTSSARSASSRNSSPSQSCCSRPWICLPIQARRFRGSPVAVDGPVGSFGCIVIPR